jgi:hypothetical protein
MLKEGDKPPLSPTQEQAGVLVFQNPPQAEEQDFLEGALLLGRRRFGRI